MCHVVVCGVDTSPLEVLVDRASKRLYEMLVIGEHVTLKVTSHGMLYVPLFTHLSALWQTETGDCPSIFSLSENFSPKI